MEWRDGWGRSPLTLLYKTDVKTRFGRCKEPHKKETLKVVIPQ
ncbi:hypothetical protein ACQ4M4_20815 [Leptolyngbya sp. AN02str]